MFQNKDHRKMDKKIGNSLLVFCLITSTLLHSQAVRLFMQDLNHNSIRQAEKAVPFILQVVADNIEGAQRPYAIKGLEVFDMLEESSSQSTTIVNGQRNQRIVHNYIVKSDKTGTFTIGPVEIKNNESKVIVSEPLQVRIGDQVITHNLKKQPYFLEVKLNKKSLYVGEELLIKIRFYYVDEFQNLRIVKPDLQGFFVESDVSQSVVGTDKMNGDDYNYQEWILKVFPEQTGTLIIPPFQAVFMMPANFQQGLLGLFDVFSMSSERIVHAPARSVDVLALPESDVYKDVTAVGRFNNVSFELGNLSAEVGEGVVGIYKIFGVGNVESFKAPLLILPNGLRYYESNSSVKKINNDLFEKTFEYILQADKPGTFEIPKQVFNYFDNKEQKYKQLYTNNSFISIKDTVLSSNQLEKQQEEQSVKKYQNNYVFKDNQIDFVYQNYLYHEQSNTILPYILFWLLMLFGWLSFIILVYWLYCTYIGIKILELYWIYYLVVRIKLVQSVRRKNVQNIYKNFYDVSKRYSFDLQSEEIIEYFKKNHKSSEFILQWKNFVADLLHEVFASNNSHNQLTEKKLLEQSVYWMKELLRYCYTLHNISSTSIN